LIASVFKGVLPFGVIVTHLLLDEDISTCHTSIPC
jgi:hypothetical protein